MTICAKCAYYKGAINSIIYYERSFTSVTGAFSHYIAFVIEVACGFIAKISGDALVIFLLDYLVPRGITARENMKTQKQRIFSILAILTMAVILTCIFTACDKNGGQEQQHKHTYSQEWSHNDISHWHNATCEHVSLTSEFGAHSFEGDTCTICGYTKNKVAVTKITLNKSSIDLVCGDSFTLTATIFPSNATLKNIIWSSSEPSIATASSTGVVTALAQGTTTIIASIDNITASCVVTVSKADETSSISLNEIILSLNCGDVFDLIATVFPLDNTQLITWSSSDSAIASVSQNGKVTAISKGNAIITASITGASATCSVTVLEKETSGLLFTQYRNGYAVTGYEGSDTIVTVPSTYNNKPVVSIGTGNGDGFSYCSSIKEVILPNTIQQIQSKSFLYCTSLENIEIPSCLDVGEKAFGYCVMLNNVVIPSNCVTIGTEVFIGDAALTDLEILGGTINILVLKGCDSLLKLTIGEDVIQVQDKALSPCINLKQLNIARLDKPVQSLFDSILYMLTKSANFVPINFTNVDNIIIPEENTDWVAQLKWLTIDGKRAYYANEILDVTSWQNYVYHPGQKDEIRYKKPSIAYAKCYFIPEVLDKVVVTKQQLSLLDEKISNMPCKVEVLNRCPIIDAVVHGESECYIDEFDFGNYSIDITRDSGEKETIMMNKTLFEDNDLVKTKTLGSHSLSLNIEGFNKIFNLTIKNHQFSDNIFVSETFLFDNTAKSLYVKDVPEGTTTVYSQNSFCAIGEYLVSVTVSKQYYETKTITATLSIIPSEYKLTFILKFDNVENDNPSRYSSLEDFVLSPLKHIKNYEFCGWYTDKDFKTDIITLPKGTIGDKVLYAKWRSIYTYDNNTITGVTSYGKTLAEIEIPNQIDGTVINTIGQKAFEGNTTLTSITLVDGIENIKDSAFKKCSNLINITLPDSVRRVGAYAFHDTLWYSNKMSTGTIYVGKILYGISFYNPYPGLKPATRNISIEPGTLAIADSAFRAQDYVTSLEIPNSVTHIGDEAFYGCKLMNLYTIPQSVVYIGRNAFTNCACINSVKISGDIKFIGDNAFSNCTGITTISISGRDVFIGDSVFNGCSSVINMTIPFMGSSKSANNGYDQILGYFFGTSYKGGEETTQCYYEKGTSSPTYKTYYIPASLKTICISEGDVPFGAFYNCTNLENVSIGQDATSIGSSAFYKCSSLNSITIPDSVSVIGSDAFNNCTLLKSVYISDIAKWCEIDFNSNPLAYAQNLYLKNTLIQEITIPDGVKNISDYAFQNCTSLTSVIIPNSVTSIGARAFNGCSELANVTIGDGVKSIGNSAFYDCRKLANIMVGNGVTSIGENAFYYTAWYDNQPDGLVYVGNVAYGYKGSIPDNMSIVLKEGTLSIANYAFYNRSNLTNIIIPDSVTSIGECALCICDGLVSIYYNGTIAQWKAIIKGKSWNDYTWNYTVHCTDGDIENEGR